MFDKTEGAIKNEKFRDTSNIENTRYKTKTNKTGDTSNIENTRYKTKTNKTGDKTQHQNPNRWATRNPLTIGGEHSCSRRINKSCFF